MSIFLYNYIWYNDNITFNQSVSGSKNKKEGTYEKKDFGSNACPDHGHRNGDDSQCRAANGAEGITVYHNGDSSRVEGNQRAV